MMPCLSKTARPQISAVSLPVGPAQIVSPFLQRCWTLSCPNLPASSQIQPSAAKRTAMYGHKKAAYSLHKRISGICNQCDIKFYSVSDTFKISSSTQSVYRPCCSNLLLKRIRLCTTRRVSSLFKYRYLFSFFNITIPPPLSIAYKKNGCLTTVRFNLIG